MADPMKIRATLQPDGKVLVKVLMSHTMETGQRKDASGKTIFDGPYTTPEQQAAVPPELQEKVKKVEADIEFTPTPTTEPSTTREAA